MKCPPPRKENVEQKLLLLENIPKPSSFQLPPDRCCALSWRNAFPSIVKIFPFFTNCLELFAIQCLIFTLFSLFLKIKIYHSSNFSYTQGTQSKHHHDLELPIIRCIGFAK